ncbi:hypothetical protein GTW25_02355 [Aliihoeflea aestuarii]|uniref:hypothetical protein n=1 Tax=Aliihoeflea aestuarii TaxID=453840 RepID=UPI0020936411|nr:hypothetical protein [Aliihoeflea aestuarii]MCO6389870.1 hypothetical protein [Aliihoeflea aestuarii]
MDGIEQAIRRALAKGNSEDRDFREKVYRSAFAALDRSLKERPELTVENAIKRRKALQATVKSIETEHMPALPPEPVAVAPVAVEPVRPVESFEPDLRAERHMPAGDEAPTLDSFDEPRAAPRRRAAKLDTPKPAGKKRRGGGRMLSFVTGLVILLVIIAGALWAFSSFGHLIGSDMRQIEAAINESRGRTGTPPLSADGVDPDAGWTGIFQPQDIQLVSPAEDASAEAVEGESGAYMQIRSGASGAPISFAVGQDLLQRFAGQRVVFAILARGIDGESTQISVECDFAAMGDCGRTRYDIGTAQDNYLFEIALPNTAPGRGGSISITTDIAGEGRGIDVFAIRVRPAD